MQLLLISLERKVIRIQQAEFLFDERPTLVTLEFTTVSAVHQPFSILICIWTLLSLHTTFISLYEE